MSQLSDRAAEAYAERKSYVDRVNAGYDEAWKRWNANRSQRQADEAENARRLAEWEEKKQARNDRIARLVSQRDVDFVAYDGEADPSPAAKKAMHGEYAERVDAAMTSFKIEVDGQQPLNPLDSNEQNHIRRFCQLNYLDKSSTDVLRRVLGYLCRAGVIARSPEDWSKTNTDIPRPELIPIEPEPQKPVFDFGKPAVFGESNPYKPGTKEYFDWDDQTHVRENARETRIAFEKSIENLTYYNGVALRPQEQAELFIKLTEIAEQNRVMPWQYAADPMKVRDIATRFMSWGSHLDPLPSESPDAVKTRELFAKARSNVFLKHALLESEAPVPETEPSEEYKARQKQAEENKAHLIEQARLARLTPGQRRAEIQRLRQVEVDQSAAEVEARRKIVEESADAVYARERAEEIKVERKVKQIVDEFTFPKLVERVKKQRATFDANRKAAGLPVRPFATTPEQEASRMIDNLVRTGGKSTSDFA